MNCPKCNATLSDTAKFCDSCGAAAFRQAAKYAAPDGFVFDAASGLYYRMEYDAKGGEAIGATWFNAVTGEYRQSRYDTAQADAPAAAPDTPSVAPDTQSPVQDAQSPIQDGQAAVASGQAPFIDPKDVKSNAATKNRKPMAVILVLLVVCGVGVTVWLTGLYKSIPFLNPAVASELPAGIMLAEPDPAKLPQFAAPEGIGHEEPVDTEAPEPAAAEASEAAAASWATVYADFLRGQITESEEYLHFSDIGVFPVHTMEGQTAAIMQAAFYEIPGFDYPVMVLMEFLPQENNPGALDTFPFEMAYLVKDGAVVWPTTDEYAAIFAENEESGMSFVNGEAFVVFELVSWEGDVPSGEKLRQVYDWLVSQQ